MVLSNPNSKEEYQEPEYISINRRAYDKLSRQYLERLSAKSKFETSSSEIIDQIFEFHSLKPSLKVLEIGPGSGEALAYFDSLKVETVAIDISSKIIEIAKRRSPKSKFINSNVLDMIFLSGEFDIIFAGAIIHLFPKNDAHRLLSLIYKWLKPDGTLFINTTINTHSEEGYLTKVDYKGGIKRYRKKWTEREFKDFITGRFRILKTLYTDESNRDKKWVGYICCKNHEQ